MNVAIALLQILVAFLAFAAIGCAVEVAINWWHMRRPMRVPPPPLSNDERVRLYQINERATKGLR